MSIAFDTDLGSYVHLAGPPPPPRMSLELTTARLTASENYKQIVENMARDNGRQYPVFVRTSVPTDSRTYYY